MSSSGAPFHARTRRESADARVTKRHRGSLDVPSAANQHHGGHEGEAIKRRDAHARVRLRPTTPVVSQLTEPNVAHAATL